jgi:HEAT repeat protein
MRFRSLIAVLMLGLIGPGDRAVQGEEAQFLGRTRKQWIADLEPAASRRKRSHAAWALSQMAVLDAAPANTAVWLNELFLLCEDESPTVRYWGQLGLQRFAARLPADHPARIPMLKLLADAVADSALAVRLVAAETQIHLGHSESGLAVLVESLKSPQESVRIQAIDALARLGPAARPAEAAIRAATADGSDYVKHIAARALQQFDAPQE